MALIDDMKARLDRWFELAAARARIEGESASITFELFGETRGYTPADEPIYEVSVEEKFFTDHLGGAIEPVVPQAGRDESDVDDGQYADVEF